MLTLSLFKIPVRIHPAFWLLALLIGWLNSNSILDIALWVVIIFVSVLIHELGHALTAIAFKQHASIDLVAFGGLTSRSGKHLSAWQEFLIVLNGPLAGAILAAAAYAGFVYATRFDAPLLVKVLFMTSVVNAFWTVLNLFPVHPLDGGHLLSIVLKGFFGLHGLRLALFISSLVGLAAALYFFMNNQFLAGAIFMLLTVESFRNWYATLNMTQLDQNRELQHQLRLAELLIREGDINKAQSILERLTQQTTSGVIYNSAVTYLAQIYLNKNDPQKALGLLLPIAGKLEGASLEMLVRSAYHAGDYATAVKYGNTAYQEKPSHGIALINAMSQAQLGNAKPAVGWFQSAIRDGLSTPKDVAKHPEFDNIRSTREWTDFEQKLETQ